MKDTELKQLLYTELYRTFIRGVTENTFSTLEEAADFARKQEASQFFISASAASKVVSRIVQRNSLIEMNAGSRRRIWMLYDMYQAYLREHPGNTLSRTRILELLVEEKAPEYFLSAGRAKHIIVNEQKKLRNKLSR